MSGVPPSFIASMILNWRDWDRLYEELTGTSAGGHPRPHLKIAGRPIHGSWEVKRGRAIIVSDDGVPVGGLGL